MLSDIICIEGITCPASTEKERNTDFEAAIGKRRAATPHFYELETIMRRGL